MKYDPRYLLSSPEAIETPCLVLDLDRVRENLGTLRAAFEPLSPRILYSCKANAEPALLKALYDAGCGFDIASIGELSWLEEAGIPAPRAVFSSTIKAPGHIADAFARGVDTFAADCPAEIEKLATIAPGAKVLARLDVPHEGSRWPLAEKFGIPPLEAIDLLRLAQERGLRPFGLTFHVGSQCERPQSWSEAIELAGGVWIRARDAGLPLQLVNFGGGIPARYTEDVPSVADIGREVCSRVTAAFGWNAEYAIEPGRFIVADAGAIVATVIGTATRNHRPWVFIDLSIYAGLLEVIGGWRYPIATARDHLAKQSSTLAGPTCDSTDIIAKDIQLPPLELGDRVLLLSTGAYTTAYKEYNGFTYPHVIAVGDRRAASEAA